MRGVAAACLQAWFGRVVDWRMGESAALQREGGREEEELVVEKKS